MRCRTAACDPQTMRRRRPSRTALRGLPRHSAHRYSTPRLLRALAAFAAVCAFAQTSDYEQGIARFQQGDAAGAVPFLTRAAEANPKNAQMWKALGVAYASQKEYAAA